MSADRKTYIFRVDAEVFRWMQQQTLPHEDAIFKDTPNAVLRRIAGLDTKKEG